MQNFPIKKVALHLLFAFLFLAPLGTNAQTPSGGTNWLSHMFNWQIPLVNHLSNLFENRKDNVENNSIARNRLLDWRRGVISVNTSSPSITDSDASSTSIINFDASSSPMFIPAGLFEEKKTAIIVELITAKNSLRKNELELADFISNSTANGKDMSEADNILTKADGAIDNADKSINAFENYEPIMASSSYLVDLKIPQSYLDTAIMDIQTARASLKSAIATTANSL